MLKFKLRVENSSKEKDSKRLCFELGKTLLSISSVPYLKLIVFF